MRSISLSFGYLLLAAGAFGCGSQAPSVTIESLIPTDNEVAGWTRDTGRDQVGSMSGIARNYTELTALIDGGAEHFQGKFSSAGHYRFKSDRYLIEFLIFQATDVATAKTLYTELVSSTDYRYSWTPQSIGDEARLAIPGASDWLNVRKSLYYFEIKLTTASGDNAPEDPAPGIEFAKAVASKIK